MPRGTSPLDEARLQGRLWTPGALLTTYVNTNRLDTLEFGTGVSRIKNLGTNGSTADLTQSTGSAQPTLSRLATGQTVLTLTPSQHISQASNTAGAPTSNGTHTVFGVARLADAGTTARIISSPQINWLLGWWSNQREWYDGSFLATPRLNPWDRNWHVIVCRATAGTPLWRDNGVQLGVSGTVTNGPGSLGFNGHSERSDCIVAALGCTPNALSLGDIERIEGALMWEFGLQARLAASHPYRNRPPLIGG